MDHIVFHMLFVCIFGDVEGFSFSSMEDQCGSWVHFATFSPSESNRRPFSTSNESFV